jgi:hypothetical protein
VGFINKCFASDEQAMIPVSDVDNSKASCGNSNYYCDDTQDKVFMLSYKDYSGISSKTIAGVATDFARSSNLSLNGLSDGDYAYGNTNYWLRSPQYMYSSSYSNYAFGVAYNTNIGIKEVNASNYGIRPAMNLTHPA